ncbi:hypothetical protein [Streptomyces griseomycini]|uniref:Uncharacterized protein n=1 Tax=Streptomyces griseomycini TaxID=66895 RepID=A0A7W7PRZ8_9ACTN|nr:hypothetical protein [Streptomyces griseomycini]MBB4900317.1 hypothetical protein [Streptomyces griseomycini]
MSPHGRTSPHRLAAPAPSLRPHPAGRDRRAWVAPAVATALLTVLGPFAVLLGGLSAMATDNCGPDDCSQALTTSLTLIYGTLFYGGVFTFCAWLTAWLLPWKPRWSVPRAWAAAASVLPPLFVLALVLNLPEG